MSCIFCGEDSGLDLPGYKKICSLCYDPDIDYDNIDDDYLEEEEELKDGTHD